MLSWLRKLASHVQGVQTRHFRGKPPHGDAFASFFEAPFASWIFILRLASSGLAPLTTKRVMGSDLGRHVRLPPFVIIQKAPQQFLAFCSVGVDSIFIEL